MTSAKLAQIFERFMFLVSAPKCVGCGERLDIYEKALCSKCSSKFTEIKARNCSICAKALSQCDCSNQYLETHYIKKLIKVFRYIQREENVCANRLIYSLKRDNRSDVLDVCADELFDAIKISIGDISDCVITNVPRRKQAIIKYGIDHAALLAKAISKRTGAKYISILKSNARVSQKTVRGKTRIDNAEFDIKRDVDLNGKTVVIIDDIVTTGASMGACAMLLHGMGAKKIFGATLAIAFRDKQTVFSKY